MFIGTPKGSNHFKTLRDFADTDDNENWTLKEFKASETKLIDEEELKDAKNAMGENKYEQEFEISFEAPIVGAFYGELLKELTDKNRIREIIPEAATQKVTAWDLGMSDSTAIWVAEIISGEVRVMDFYEASGESLDHYIKWLDEKGYRDYTHIMPHDVNVRELQTGKSRYQFLTEAGLDIEVAPKSSVEDGIQAVRRILPNCWFNKDKTRAGVECLQNYRRVFNEKTSSFQNRPLHDWSSHAADAFRYLALGMDSTGNGQRTDWSKPFETTLDGDSYKDYYV
jgi:hypothetical protein